MNQRPGVNFTNVLRTAFTPDQRPGYGVILYIFLELRCQEFVQHLLTFGTDCMYNYYQGQCRKKGRTLIIVYALTS